MSRNTATDVELRPTLWVSIMPSDPVRIADQVRFGEDFELDLRSYELRRSGRVLKLERIPMELLLLLIEERGHLVTRDRIIERIWGKDVFLDTDNSINAAIRKIRQVLKDDPEQPRFVQTITGRGYRFIASVLEVNPPGSVPIGASPPPVQGMVSSPAEGLRVRQPGKLWRTLTPVVILIVAALVFSVFYRRSVKVNRLTEKDTMVLSDFTNTTAG